MNTPWYAVAALCISTVALIVAAKNYLRKSGLFVRGAFTTCSSIDCNDTYISSVILENLKDRAVTIFAIYIRYGHGCYLEIEDFEERPLILKPFETQRLEYGPIQFYSSNGSRIDMDALIKKKIKKCLVLSTADGKYVVPSHVRMWSPYGDFFKNHLTEIVQPIRAKYKDKAIGGNAKYVVDILTDNGKEEIIPKRANDFELRVFSGFHLTRESLENKAALESFLGKQMELGNLSCKSFKVVEMDSWKENTYQSYTPTINAEHYGALQYYVFGRLLTRYSDWKLKRENARRNPK